tara:strand:+ start:667 stop:957 length:291 start_codon:yes stop_codon:yes gene_type:complete
MVHFLQNTFHLHQKIVINIIVEKIRRCNGNCSRRLGKAVWRKESEVIPRRRGRRISLSPTPLCSETRREEQPLSCFAERQVCVPAISSRYFYCCSA